MSLIDRIHHVAYRCKDAGETVERYEPEPYMHVLDARTDATLGAAPGGSDPDHDAVWLP